MVVQGGFTCCFDVGSMAILVVFDNFGGNFADCIDWFVCCLEEVD